MLIGGGDLLCLKHGQPTSKKNNLLQCLMISPCFAFIFLQNDQSFLGHCLHLPQFLQCPVMGCSILLVLHLYRHDGPGERTFLAVFGSIRRKQIRRQRRIQSVCEEYKLKLDLHVKDQCCWLVLL